MLKNNNIRSGMNVKPLIQQVLAAAKITGYNDVKTMHRQIKRHLTNFVLTAALLTVGIIFGATSLQSVSAQSDSGRFNNPNGNGSAESTPASAGSAADDSRFDNPGGGSNAQAGPSPTQFNNTDDGTFIDPGGGSGGTERAVDPNHPCLDQSIPFQDRPACPPGVANAGGCQSSSALLGLPTWYKYLDATMDETGGCSFESFSFPGDIGKVLLAVFEILIRLSAIVAVGYVIYGGFKYILSRGEPDKLAAARTTIINALVGIVIAISATVIVNLIARSLG